MDEKVVFGNKPSTSQPPAPAQAQPPAATQQAPRITLQDLYGSSQPGQAQPPVQEPAPIQQAQQPQQPSLPVQPPAPSQSANQNLYQQPMTQKPAQPAQIQTPPSPAQPSVQAAPTVPPATAQGNPPGGTPPLGTPPPPPPPIPNSFLQKMMHGRFGKIAIAGIGILVLLLIIGGVSRLFSSGDTGPKENVTLTYWGLWEDPKTMRTIISDFERENPNIKIEYTKQDIKKYKDRVTTRITNNTGPDIYTYHNTWLPTLSTMLLPVSSDVISADDFKKTYFPVVQTDVVRNGAIYGIPQGMDTLALYINKELFDAAGLTPPQSWDEFIRAAKSLTVKDQDGRIRTAGAALGSFDNIQHASDIISLLMIQNGIPMNEIEKHSSRVADALTFYISFVVDRENVWTDREKPSQLAFASGELAMFFGYSWDTFIIKAANPDLVFEVHPVPNLPGKQATIASYWVNGISSKTKHQAEAQQFMKFLAKKETAQKLYTEASKTRAFGTPYARKDLANTLRDVPNVGPFITQAEYAQSTFFASDTEDTAYNNRLNVYLGNAVRAIIARESAETAVNTLLQGVTQVRAQYGKK